MKKLLGNSYGFILGFTPWVLFSIFYTQNKQDMLLACGLAFLSNLILNHKMVYKMFWLPTASTLFFLVEFINVYFSLFSWSIKNPSALSGIAIALICWLSIILRAPFTLQYAKEETPKEYWSSKLFIKINYVLSIMWSVMLTISAIPAITLPQYIYSNSFFWGWCFNSLCILIAIILNKKIIQIMKNSR